MCEHFKQFDVNAEMIATWAGVQDIKDLEGNQGKITELRELFKACKAGGNPQILFGKEEEGEIEFNMGEQEL